MATYYVDCPVCGEEDAIDVSLTWDNHGADADGRRGELRHEGAIEVQGCGCDLTEEEEQSVIQDAFEQDADSFDEPDYD